MPSSLALLLTVSLIVAWLWRASRREVGASAALWLPVLWLAVIGSRFVSQWLFPGAAGGLADPDGSPVDALFFAAMNVLGALVLIQRRRAVARILRDNPLVVLILLYAFASIAWSDFPFVSFKRYIKALGHPIMALVVATDPRPQRALQIVLKTLRDYPAAGLDSRDQVFSRDSVATTMGGAAPYGFKVSRLARTAWLRRACSSAYFFYGC